MSQGFFSETDTSREIPVKDRQGKMLRLKNEGSILPQGKSENDRVHFRIGKVVWRQQSNYPQKVILIEQLLWPDGTEELRFGYRITTSKKGVWWWGESALMAPLDDVQALLQLAKEKKLISA